MNSPAHAGTEWGRLSAIYREAHYNFLPLGQRFCNSLANFTSSSVHCGIPTVFDIFLNGFGDRLIAQARPSRRERFHFHNRAGHQCRAFAAIHQLIEIFFAHGPVASRINHRIRSVSGMILGCTPPLVMVR